ncbi:MAG TPA: glycosyl hydrolase family 28 protein [Polyangiaceae bacterium]
MRHCPWLAVSAIVASVAIPLACGGTAVHTGSDAEADASSGGTGPANGASSSGSGGASNGSSGGSGGGSSSGASDAGATSSSTGGSSSSGSSSSGVVPTDGGPNTCAGDTSLPAQPTIPPACTTLQASLTVASGGVPSETNMDTARIQTALTGCGSGHSVQLTTNGANNAFITGPITIPSGVTLWVDSGATLYGTRSLSVYGSASGLITVKGSNQGIMGEGTIDGQGGEPIIGGTGTWWDQNGNGGTSPALVVVSGATNFTMYQITLHDSPMFHVKLSAAGFMVWGVTIKTPSKATNSAGTALTPTSAHNTDGIDPGETASNGYIVCSNISDGDDQIAIKGGTNVNHLTIAHNHFLAGHGMSIGSEATNVSDINVYDLSIDGTTSGFGGGSSNGIRIKSDPSAGGAPGVQNVTYSDVCVRDLANPIIITPRYTTSTGTMIPMYGGITIRDFHALQGALSSTVTIDGFDSSHITGLTLDNVVVDGTKSVTATEANIVLGPGMVNFTPSGTGVTVTDNQSGTSTANPCTNKFVTF